MSTTLFVNSIADLSIFSRQKAGGNPSEKEWVLESPTYSAAKQQWGVEEFILSDNYTSLVSDGRNSGGKLVLTVDTLPSPPGGTRRDNSTNSQSNPYQFGGGPSPQEYIFIEDITMGFKWSDPLPSNVYNLGANQMMVVFNVEETGPDQYEHNVWSS